MGKMFDYDSPFMRFISRMSDIIWLNILFILCSVPIFTIGTSYTSLNSVMLSIMRKEDRYITKDFLKAFKNNFKKVTPTWLGILAAYSILIFDLLVLMKSMNPGRGVIFGILCVTLFFIMCTNLYTFALYARFSNTAANTLKNAFLLSMSHFFITITMLVDILLPFVLTYYNTYFVPAVLLFGFSGPAFINSFYFNRLFIKLEEALKNREILFFQLVSKECEEGVISAYPQGSCIIKGGRYDGRTLGSVFESKRELFGGIGDDKFPFITCAYDYGTPDNVLLGELHRNKSIDANKCPDRKKIEKGKEFCKETLVEGSGYIVCSLTIDGKLVLKQDSPFVNVSVICGNGMINSTQISKGDNFIIPAGFGKYSISGKLSLIMSSVS